MLGDEMIPVLLTIYWQQFDLQKKILLTFIIEIKMVNESKDNMGEAINGFRGLMAFHILVSWYYFSTF